MAAAKFDVLADTGRQVLIACPHCATQFWAYVWSFSSVGKRCPGCAALHKSNGIAIPRGGLH